MSIELFAAEKLLEMALGAIVGDAASGLTNSLWTKIRDRLRKNQPVIEAEIVDLEQNPTQENLKRLEPFLHVEMRNDTQFAEEISKLAREIASASSGDTIEMQDFQAENVVGKAEANQQFFGGTHTHEKK